MNLLLVVFGLLFMPAHAAQGDAVTSTTRGITGKVVVETDAGTLRGRPDLDLESPMLVRLARIEELGDGRRAFELEFIGSEVGSFDLRDVLVFENGSDIELLDPIPVEIVSNLALDAPTDLVLVSPPPASLEGGYTVMLIVIGIVWILIPILFMLRRLVQPRPEVEVPEHVPTLAEKIAPLVESASQRDLSTEEQGRLELLLYAHWQEKLDLGDDRPSAVARLRRHETAGTLLRAVERWIHDPSQSPPPRSEITSLLEPYRHVSAGGAE